MIIDLLGLAMLVMPCLPGLDFLFNNKILKKNRSAHLPDHVIVSIHVH